VHFKEVTWEKEKSKTGKPLEAKKHLIIKERRFKK
jgi:hypothetical protein